MGNVKSWGLLYRQFADDDGFKGVDVQHVSAALPGGYVQGEAVALAGETVHPSPLHVEDFHLVDVSRSRDGDFLCCRVGIDCAMKGRGVAGTDGSGVVPSPVVEEGPVAPFGL